MYKVISFVLGLDTYILYHRGSKANLWTTTEQTHEEILVMNVAAFFS